MVRAAVFSVLMVLAVPALLFGQRAFQTKHPMKEVTAQRVTGVPPKIDGLLDDEVWTYAGVTSDFQQLQPIENGAPTESTVVYMAYDDEAFYVGVMLFDKDPDKIVARLARRDRGSETDRINIYFDPYLDHQTGYQFTITAGGSLTDALLYNDTRTDDTWDAIWDARSSRHDRGWSAEFKIPLRILRFNDSAEEQTWGFQLTRYISRKQEWDQWVLQRRDNSGWVSRFGHINGIKGIRSRTPVEMLPYSVGRTTFEPKSPTNADGREFFSNAGADLRYGVTSNTTLHATFNPDFGQVDADPAVLNLSVFETFFQERRPFFVEGQQVFRTPIQLFYTRRIGRRPGYFFLPAGAQELDRPDFTTILAAAKFTGKTQKKTSFGLVNAVTTSEESRMMLNGTSSDFRVEPFTNFLVGRLQQDFRQGNSQIGFIGTAVNRKGGHDAYTGGIDWNHKMYNNLYRISGQVAGTRTGRTARQQGYGLNLQIAKDDGWLRGNMSLDALSPGFNANDLGFTRRSNNILTSYGLDVIRVRPTGPFLQNNFWLYGSQNWNYDRLHLQNEIEFGMFHQFKNFWGLNPGVTYHFETLDDLDTRGGPPIVKPAGWDYYVWIGSDISKPVSGGVFTSWGSNEGGSTNRYIGPSLTLRPSARIELRLNPGYSWNHNDAQYVTQRSSGGQTEYVYGELDSKVLDLTTRADILFNRDISLQFYIQPFVAVGDYAAGRFKALAAPSSYTFTPVSDPTPSRDFNSRSLRSNLVFRWEYRPGSTLFFVWSQSRSAFSNDPAFRPFRSIGNTFSDDGPNIFMVKFNYFFNI
jgi:hypothetical protein